MECYLGTVGLLPEYHLEDRVHVSFEALPADVCRDGYLDGQRTAEEVEVVGAVDG